MEQTPKLPFYGLDGPAEEGTGAKPETANVAVFVAYAELSEARTVSEKVAILERLYAAGRDDAIRSIEEGDESAVDRRECEG